MRWIPLILALTLAVVLTPILVATTPEPERVDEPPLGPQTAERLAENLLPSVVDVRVPASGKSGAIGIGTGVVYGPGIIITNDHVITSDSGSLARDIVVISAGNVRHQAVVVGRDANADIAVLRIGDDRLPPARFASSIEGVRPGQRALAAGAPHTLPDSIATGPITDITEQVTMPGRPDLKTLIETSARTKPGYSGGPLVNRTGEVIGITVGAIGEGTELFRGYAIPIDQVLTVTRSIVAASEPLPATSSTEVWRGVLAKLPTCPVPDQSETPLVAQPEEALAEAAHTCTIWRPLADGDEGEEVGGHEETGEREEAHPVNGAER
jgi:S1-C subfamily serine protease